MRRIIFALLILTSGALAQKGQPRTEPKPTLIQRLFRAVGYEDRAYNIHNDGKIATYFTNYGLIGYFNPSVEYPTNTERYYAWQIGVMVGAMVDTSDDGTSNAVPLVRGSTPAVTAPPWP